MAHAGVGRRQSAVGSQRGRIHQNNLGSIQEPSKSSITFLKNLKPITGFMCAHDDSSLHGVEDGFFHCPVMGASGENERKKSIAEQVCGHAVLVWPLWWCCPPSSSTKLVLRSFSKRTRAPNAQGETTVTASRPQSCRARRPGRKWRASCLR
jgi:hypothetical protein